MSKDLKGWVWGDTGGLGNRYGLMDGMGSGRDWLVDLGYLVSNSIVLDLSLLDVFVFAMVLDPKV